MSSYPGRGFVVGNGSSISLPLVTESRLRSVKIFFLFTICLLFLLCWIFRQVYSSMWLIRHTCDIVMHIQHSVPLCQILLIEKLSDVVCAQLRGMVIILELSKLLIYLLPSCSLRRKINYSQRNSLPKNLTLLKTYSPSDIPRCN